MGDVFDDIALERASAAPPPEPPPLAEPPVPEAPPAPEADPFADIAATREQTRATRVNLLRDVMSATGNPDEKAASLEIARKTGAPVDFVRHELPFWKARVDNAQNDPEKFYRDNPELAGIAIDNPFAGEIITKDKPLNTLQATLRGFRRLVGFTYLDELDTEQFGAPQFGGPNGSFLRAFDPASAIPGEIAGVSPAIEQQKVVRSPLSDSTGLDRAGIYWDSAKKSVASLELGYLTLKYFGQRKFGLDTFETEKSAVDLRSKSMEADYNAGPGEQILLDATQFVGSHLASLGTTVAVSAVAGPVVGAVAGFGSSFVMESGQFWDFRAQVDDKGRPVDDDVAMGAALGYAAVAATIETGVNVTAWIPFLGPLGKTGTKASVKEFLAKMAKDPARAVILSKAAREWAKVAAEEGLEEASQNLASDVAGWMSRSRSAGIAEGQVFVPQKADPLESIGEAIDVGASATVGAFVMGAGGAGRQAYMADRSAQRSIRAEQQLRAINKAAAESPTAVGVPDAFVRAVAAETEATDGEAVTHAHIDVEGLVRLAQENDLDPIAMVEEAIGKAAAEGVRAALATGEKLAVPMAEYITQWSKSGLADALIADTTTRANGVPTPNERVKSRQSLAEGVKEILASQDAGEDKPTANETLITGIIDELAKAGRHTKKDARTMAAVWRARVRTAAERMKMDVDEVAGMVAVKIARDNPGVPAIQGLVQAATTGTASAEFTSWFSGSKVVDGQGLPLLMYRGSAHDEGTTALGEWFTSRTDEASGYATSRAAYAEKSGEGQTAPNVTPVYLALKNPLVVDAKNQNWHNIEIDIPDAFTGEPIKGGVATTDQIVDWAKEQGHDGVLILNVLDHSTEDTRGTSTVAAVFEQTSVKSAIANRGTWDANAASILDQEARELLDRVVQALNEPSPSPDAEVVAPPGATRLMQLERELEFDANGNIVKASLKGSGFGEYLASVRKWMEKQGYTEQEIQRHLKALEGQLKIFSALGARDLRLLPAGDGGTDLTPEGKKRKVPTGPIRKNVDPIYKISFDASAMCVKRLEASATQAYVQEKLGRPLTASERIALVAFFKEAGKTAPCLYCYVESPRAKAGDFVARALAVVTGEKKLRKGAKAAEKKAAQKAIAQFKKLGLKAEDLNPNFLLDPDTARTAEAQKQVVAHGDIYDFLAQQANYAKANQPKLYAEYRGQVLGVKQADIDELNQYAGFRFFSTSDFQAEHVIDLIQAFQDLALRGARAHAYTKVADFVRIFGRTGMKIQTSIFAKEVDGKFVADTWQGMDWEQAKAFRQQFKNVGTVFVATSDAQVAWALDQKWIDYVIPFHYSGLEKKYYEQLGWADFTATQNEKKVKGVVRERDGKFEVMFYGKITGTFATEAEAMAARKQQVKKFKAPAGKVKKIRMHELGAHEGVSDKEMTRRYLKLAKERGVEPVFAKFADHPNYAKLKKDYARSDTRFDAVNAKLIDTDAAGAVLETVFQGTAPRAKVDKKIGNRLHRLIEAGNEELGVATLKALEAGVPVEQMLTQIGGTRLEQGQDQEQPLEKSPGPRGWIDTAMEAGRRVVSIFLTEKADLSTFLHETGHAFWELQADLAERPDAPAGVKADYEAALKWMGVASRQELQDRSASANAIRAKAQAENRALTAEEKAQVRDLVEPFEKWARGFEAYLMTGKAPSLGLAGAFAQFKLWLVEVYKHVRNLRVDLTPEITGIFDRMLATDAEMEAAARGIGLTGPAVEAAKSRAEIAALKEVSRVHEAWWKKELEAEVERADAEFEALPAKRAWAFLRRGEGDDRLKALGNDVKLDFRAVVDAVGLDAAERLFKGLLQKFTTSEGGGLHPDHLAALLGVEDGKTLLQQMVAVPGKAEWVAARADEAMRAKHPGILEERSRLKALVDQALHEEPSVVEELHRAWAEDAKEAGVQTPSPEAARQAAKILTSKKSVQQFDPAQYARQERAEAMKRAVLGAEAAKAKAKMEAAKAAREKAVAELSTPAPAKEGDTAADVQARVAKLEERIARAQDAEAKAQAKYREAAAKKAQSSSRRLLNFYMSVEARRLQKVAERTTELSAKMLTEKGQERLGKASAAARNVVLRVLQGVGFVQGIPPEAEVSGMAELMAVFDAQEPVFEMAGMAGKAHVDFDPTLIENLYRNPKAFEDLTAGELEQLQFFLLNVRTMTRAMTTVKVGNQRVALQALVGDIANEASRLPKQPAPFESATQATFWQGRTWTAVKEHLASLDDPLTTWLDDDWLGKSARVALRDGYYAARAVEDRLLEDVAKKVVDAFDKMPKAMQASRLDVVDRSMLGKSSVRQGPVDRLWMWQVLANLGNAGNMQRLLEGRGWTMDEVMEFFRVNRLTREEAEFIQSLWDLNDKHLWPALSKVYEAIHGTLPAKVEAQALELELANGDRVTLRGGYYPAMGDPLESEVGARQEQTSTLNAANYDTFRASLLQGFTRGRIEGAKYVIRLDDFHNYPAHVSRVIRYIAYEEFVRDANRILRAIKPTIDDRLGPGAFVQLDRWLKVVASGSPDSISAAERGGLAIFGRLINRVIQTAMMLNIKNAMADIANPLLAGLGPKSSRVPYLRYVLPTVLEGTAGLVVPSVAGVGFHAMRQFAMKHSVELPARHGKVLKKMRKAFDRALSEGKKYRPLKKLGSNVEPGHALDWAHDHGFILQETMATWGETIVWTAAYRWAIRKTGGDQAEAIRRADDVVQKTFPSDRAAERSHAVRSKGFLGALFIMGGYFNKVGVRVHQIAHEGAVEWAHTEGWADKAKFAATSAPATGAMIMGVLAVVNVLGSLLEGRGPEPEEDELEWVKRKMLSAPFVLHPVLSQAQGLIEAAVAQDNIKGKVAFSASERSAPAVGSILRMLNNLGAVADSDKTDSRRLWAAYDATALVLGLPASQVKRTGQALLKDGDTTLWELIYGPDDGTKPANPGTIGSR